jgi:O-antigen ligase
MRKFIFVILLLMIFGILFLTVSRGPWLALSIEIFIFIILLRKKNLKYSLFVGSTGIFVFLLVVFVFSTLDFLPEYTSEIINPSKIDWRFTDEATSEYYRIALLKAVINHLQGARWLFGLGPGTFHLAGIESTYAGHEHVLLAADSHYIRVLADSGLIGLTVFFALLFGILKECLKSVKITKGKDKITAIACFAGISGFIIANITVSMFVMLPLKILFWMATARAITLKNKYIF